MRREFVSGTPATEIVARHGLKLDTLQKRVRRSGWISTVTIARNRTCRAIATAVQQHLQDAQPVIQAAVSNAVSEWTRNAHRTAGHLVGQAATQPQPRKRLQPEVTDCRRQ